MFQLQVLVNTILTLFKDQYSDYLLLFIYLVTKWISIYLDS